MKDIYEILKSRGYEISEDLKKYYDQIKTWREMWNGFVPEFHKYKISVGGNRVREIKRHTLGMAKKVAEDWANLLLNDKTLILIDDEATQSFLTGDEVEQNGGILNTCKFWARGNNAIEKAYAMGTAAFIIGLKNAIAIKGRFLKAESVTIKVIKDADKIIPLSYDDDDVKSLAIYSKTVKDSKEYLYLQIFEPSGENDYIISNSYYEKNQNGYTPVENIYGEVDSYVLPGKPFFLVKPAIENNNADVPMGLSCYANAKDQILGCDVAFDNFFNDLILGRKKVFMDQSVLAVTEEPIVINGEAVMEADGVTPATRVVPSISETIEQSLFVCVDSERQPGEKRLFQEYNPDLRVEANERAVQMSLNLLSAKVGFGQKRYRFDGDSMSTATEARISNKDLTESVWKQRIGIQEVLVNLVRNTLIIAKEKCGANVNPDAKIVIKFDDSMFTDEEQQRSQDLQEVKGGIMSKVEYRVKWYGESEEEATESVKKLQSEKKLNADEPISKSVFGGE